MTECPTCRSPFVEVQDLAERPRLVEGLTVTTLDTGPRDLVVRCLRGHDWGVESIERAFNQPARYTLTGRR